MPQQKQDGSFDKPIKERAPNGISRRAWLKASTVGVTGASIVGTGSFSGTAGGHCPTPATHHQCSRKSVEASHTTTK
ncbi:hypothetical protein [Haladaptatus pallidirubidus]|uniref:hypothetical protein n=1 Tax=Haladaptatus pallidirubidus TaxID=1008152 RepID=UPI001D0F9C1C|nr:hypothetical protein [Haladaptatus pallidirubidus]